MGKIQKFFLHIKNSFRNAIMKYFATILLIIGTGWIISDALWTIINIFDYYNGTQILAHNDFLWIIVIMLPASITIVYLLIALKLNKLKSEVKSNQEKFLQDNEIVRFHRNIIDDCFDEIYKYNKEILLKDIKNAYDNENWRQVIKIGRYGARLFLMLACYDLRIDYGRYIVLAAEYIGERESIAMGYIDCIGWSYVKLGKYDDAIESINKGLSYLSDIDSNDGLIMKCKANRHLLSIMLEKGEMQKAKSYRDIFEKYLGKLRGRDRRIMDGSLHIINGDISSMDHQDYEAAKEHYLEAKRLFSMCDDFEREVKVNYKLGVIDERMGQLRKALKNFLIGFWLSDKVSRLDEKLKNCKGICRLVQNDASVLHSLRYDSELEAVFKEKGVKCSFDEEFYISELSRIERTSLHSRNTSDNINI